MNLSCNCEIKCKELRSFILFASIAATAIGYAQNWQVDAAFAPVIETAGIGGVVLCSAYPGGKVLIETSYASIDGVIIGSHIERLNGDGSLDSSFTGPIASVLDVYPDGRILVRQAAATNGVPVDTISRLKADGSVDPSFSAVVVAGSSTQAILLSGGRVLIYGYFSTVNGSSQYGVAIVDGNGSPVGGFSSPFSSPVNVSCVVPTTDGHFLVGGTFSNTIVRLNANGGFDVSFNADSSLSNATASRIYPEPDGSLLVPDGLEKLVHLAASGARDNAFVSRTVGSPYAFGVQQSDGRIYYLTNNNLNQELRRLNGDGSADSSFVITTPYAAAYAVGLPAISDDGSYFIPAALTQERYASRSMLTHVLSDGSIDDGFSPRFSRLGAIESFVRQPDGKYVITGLFDWVDGSWSPGSGQKLARLNAAGSMDSSFSATLNPGESITALALQSGGKIIAAGSFLVGNSNYVSVARFNADGGRDGSFQPPTSLLTSTAVGNSSFQCPLSGVLDLVTPLADGSLVVRRNNTMLVRVLHDGTVDTGFSPDRGVSPSGIIGMAALPDGRILVCDEQSGLSENLLLTRLGLTGAADYVHSSPNTQLPPLSDLGIQLDIGSALLDLLQPSQPSAGIALAVHMQDGKGQLTMNVGIEGVLTAADQDSYGISNSFQRYTTLPGPTARAAGAVTASGFNAGWGTVAGATGYRLDVSSDSSFGSFVSGYQNLDVGNSTSVALSGLSANTTYYYRVRSYDSAVTGAYSGTIAVTTSATVVVATPLTVTTLAGQPLASGNQDGAGSAARFRYPCAVAADNTGNLYLADTDNDTIRKIVVSTGAVTTLAGLAGISGSADGTGSAARFNRPSGVKVDEAGDIYVADTLNNTLRKVTATGAVSTLAGQAGLSGSADGTGTAAQFFGPQGLAIDVGNNLYVADTNNHVIRKVVLSTGVVTTAAGSAGNSGSADGLGSQGRFSYPSGVAVNGAGNLFVADTENHTIRQILPSGMVNTLTGLAGYSGGADGTGTAARFDSPSDVAVDPSGTLYVADTDNCTIRKVVPSTGTVTTLAGLAGTAGSADGSGSAVRFFHPAGIAVDSSSNLYVADTDNHTVRVGLMSIMPAIQTQPQSQTVSAGSSVQFSVTASGRPAVSYQWNFNGTAINGATSSSYSLSNTQSGSAGNYTVIVSNVMGSVTSNQAALTVNAVTPPPSGGGGGGGGGAPSMWFYGALLLLAAVRIFQRWTKVEVGGYR